MIKYAEYFNNGKLEISEKTLLDNLDRVTKTGALISVLGNKVNVFWNYEKTDYTLVNGAFATNNRDEADCIRYCFDMGNDRSAVKVNSKNNEHPSIIKAAELVNEFIL
jgi:hypothetical protein